MKFTARQIATMLCGEIKGNPDVQVHTLAKIQEGTEGSISFLANPKYEPYIYDTQASVVIVNKDFSPQREIKTTLILVEDAYSAFSKLLEEYEKLLLMAKRGIEQPCFIAEGVTIHETCYVGSFAYIGKGTSIGTNTKIYPQVYIGEKVQIGNNCIIYAGAKIFDNCVIGNNCIIHAGAVVGSPGFGFAPQADGSYKNVPQLGNVVIEDDVSIGANTTIDRATIGSTLIKQGAKLDNLIQIGHNVEVGRHTVIAAQTGIAGSSKVGDYCAIGGQVGLAGHLEIANRVQIGAKSGINSSVTEEGKQIQGYPAFEYNGFLRSSVIFRNLPELKRKIDELAKKIILLQNEK
ncbi:MAG: UDP-3-O-(3-hydroxymyristoyl)glucosamine N-acyltransferase [Microscillaceae bacterium]|nr:UDP-3-O-(3-hydroxymyristoyl)glucosamine N-acyltransferase [Microscillaceae bacterium]MDW8460245.1 UDP-3-O-(3-hydroxymyristoyl)glucosamine N-acyltransferase [Cytophagales bacterium]